MLTPQRLARWAREMGVAETQVRLDHFLSHLLLAVAAVAHDDVVFVGGTALCRTHLTEPPWRRMSEDLDLLAVGARDTTAARLEAGLPRAVRREFPDAAWVLAPTEVTPPAPALLRSGAAIVPIQLLPATGGWASWQRVPWERRAVMLSYDDLPDSIELRVPTIEGFAALKLVAWEDRQAERDLFDLAGLSTRGAFNRQTATIFQRLRGRPPDPGSYDDLPAATRASWHAQLVHQMPELPDPDECLRLVAAAVHSMPAP